MRGSGRTELHIAPGGIDSLRSQLLGPSMGLAPLGPTQALFKNAPCVFVRAACSLRSQSVQLAVASCRTPVGDSHPPRGVQHAKKKPAFSCELFFKYGDEGGLTRFARPAGSLFAALSVSPTGCRQLSNPSRGFSSPPFSENIKEKSPYFRTSSYLEYGGEGGIRTPDTLPYTHFPGVLLQPLGHLTILSSRCCRDGR